MAFEALAPGSFRKLDNMLTDHENRLTALEDGQSGASLGITGATVGQSVIVKAVDEEGRPTEWEAVDVLRTLTVACTLNDGTAVTGQTVTIREGGAEGEVLAQAPYEGVPLSFRFPIGVRWHASVSDAIPMQGKPTTASGTIGTSDTSVTLVYGTLESVLEYDEQTGRYDNASIADYLMRQRDHLVYGVSQTKTLSTAMTKTDANEGIANPTPGWAGHPAVDQYDRKRGPFLRWDVNGGCDADGTPYVTAFRDFDQSFSLDGSNGDVWSLVPTYYRKYDESGEEVTLRVSDTPHVGLEPCGHAYLPNGTLRPYMLYAKYVGVQGTDGKMHSYSGYPTWNRNVSHNSLITQCDTANTGYSGKTTADLQYVCDMADLKYGTKDIQTILMGCVSYNYNYDVTVAETGVRRAIIATSQANNLVVGSSVTIGTANNGTQVLADTRITSIEPYDATNSVVNLDAGADFDTAVGNKLSTAPWYSGRTDAVEGDGACTQAGLLSGKEPFVIQGIECLVGVNEILGNVIISNDGTSGWVPYVNHDSRNEATSLTDAYEACDAALPTTDADGWKYGLYAHESNGLQYATTTGGSTTAGMSDGAYTQKMETTGLREWRSGGSLGNGRYAGLRCVDAHSGLTNADWHIGSRRSAIGVAA